MPIKNPLQHRLFKPYPSGDCPGLAAHYHLAIIVTFMTTDSGSYSVSLIRIFTVGLMVMVL